MFQLFDDLMDESLNVAQVERAQDGLIDLLKRPGPGLDKGDEKSVALKLNDYVNKKIVLGLKRQKSDAQDQLDDASFSLRERREISVQIGKIQKARSRRALAQHEKMAADAIEGSRAPEPVKQALKKTIRRMKGFRALQLYRQKLAYLEGKVASTEEPLRQELRGLLEEIDGIEKISDLEGARGDLQSFRSALPSDRDDLLDQIEELLALKAELFLEAQSQAVKDELDALREDEPQLQVAKNDLDDILSAQDSDEFSRGISGFQGKVRGASSGFKDVVEAKSRAFVAQSEARVRERLKEAVLSDGGKKIAEDFARLASVREVDQLFIRVQRLEEEIERSSQEGLIGLESKDDLIKEAEYIKDILFYELDALGKEGELAAPASMGSGGPGESALEVPEEAFLAKIKIVPGLVEVALGEDYQAAAVGIYSDGAEEDLTFSGAWTTSDQGIFSVSQGLVESHAVGKAMLSMTFGGIKGLPVPVMVGEAQLASLLVSPQDASLSMGDRVDFRVEGYFTDSSHKDLTPYVRWEVSAPRVLRIERSQARPLMFGDAQVYALYEKLRSLPSRVRVVLTPGWLLGVILKGASFLLAGLMILASLLWAGTQIRKNRLKARLRKAPKEFVVGLYENFRDILRLFGLKEGEFLPPLYFAYLVISRYPVEGEVFLSFTKKYEEAKYSRHDIKREDALSALDDYGRSLKMLFSHGSRSSAFFKYCLALYKRTPLFLRVAQGAASASSGRPS
jgi:hypothetical protein